MQGAIVHLIEAGSLGFLQKFHQAVESFGMDVCCDRFVEEQVQVLAQQGSAEIWIAVVRIEHPLQFLVERGGIKRRRTQDLHERLHVDL